MITREETIKLIDELHTASEVYYQKLEEEVLSDEEFDGKLAYLASIQEAGHHDDLFAEGTRGFLVLEGDPALGTKPAASALVRHQVPMLSLGKAKSEDELLAFLRKARAAGASSFRVQAKLDGFALAAEYSQGRLTCLSTRGDGSVGENITYLLNHQEVSIVGLPTTLSTPQDLEIRGELFLTEKQFQKLDDERHALTGGERYKHSRNALVGIMRKAELGIGHSVEVTFSAYSVLEDGSPADLTVAQAAGVATVDTITAEHVAAVAKTPVKLTGLATDEEVLSAVAEFGKHRAALSIPTDGAVIKSTNEAELLLAMGSSSHHPRSQIAFKYPSPTAVTKLIGIDLSVGKTGKVTPIGRLETVKLDGSDISNLSLHNFNLLYTQNIRVGQVVEIHKANDIIPQVKTVISTPEGAELLPVPTECPVCSEPLQAAREEAGVWPPKTLLCKNLDCLSRNFFALKVAVGKNYLDIDGMSEKLLTHLNDSGRVTTIADLYTLTLEELQEASFGTSKDGAPVKLGEKRAKHILEHIEKSKELPITKLLASLSIPGLGNTMAKALMKHFADVDELLEATEEDFEGIAQVGDVRVAAVVAGLQHRAPLIEQLRSHGVKFATGQVASDAKLVGLSFAISGAVPEPFPNRGAWVDFVESHGGEFHSGPKATTSFMVGNPEDTSSKIKKAKALGVAIISPEEFTATYGA